MILISELQFHTQFEVMYDFLSGPPVETIRPVEAMAVLLAAITPSDHRIKKDTRLLDNILKFSSKPPAPSINGTNSFEFMFNLMSAKSGKSSSVMELYTGACSCLDVSRELVRGN